MFYVAVNKNKEKLFISLYKINKSCAGRQASLCGKFIWIIYLYEIWGFHGGKNLDCGLLGYDVMYSSEIHNPNAL
jgi:hypothetical protein